jgi:hypothetical protein
MARSYFAHITGRASQGLPLLRPGRPWPTEHAEAPGFERVGPPRPAREAAFPASPPRSHPAAETLAAPALEAAPLPPERMGQAKDPAINPSSGEAAFLPAARGSTAPGLARPHEPRAPRAAEPASPAAPAPPTAFQDSPAPGAPTATSRSGRHFDAIREPVLPPLGPPAAEPSPLGRWQRALEQAAGGFADAGGPEEIAPPARPAPPSAAARVVPVHPGGAGDGRTVHIDAIEVKVIQPEPPRTRRIAPRPPAPAGRLSRAYISGLGMAQR